MVTKPLPNISMQVLTTIEFIKMHSINHHRTFIAHNSMSYWLRSARTSLQKRRTAALSDNWVTKRRTSQVAIDLNGYSSARSSVSTPFILFTLEFTRRKNEKMESMTRGHIWRIYHLICSPVPYWFFSFTEFPRVYNLLLFPSSQQVPQDNHIKMDSATLKPKAVKIGDTVCFFSEEKYGFLYALQTRYNIWFNPVCHCSMSNLSMFLHLNLR